ncbi:MAG: PilZ domain-containing protein [Planctomycetota bacterium]
MLNGAERRIHQRYTLPSSYTEIAIRPFDKDEFNLMGHAYDISEGGIRFELDQPIEPGTRIGIRIMLPRATMTQTTEKRAIFAMGNLVWTNHDDIELGGPIRMACTITRFMQPGDLEMLRRALESGRYALAA